MRRGAKLFLMPQRPYVPLGPLRRVVTYPLPSDKIDRAMVNDLMRRVGLEYLIERLDIDAAWDHILSGGEKQRIAFVRLLLHKPDIVVMDEATSALDPASQEMLMNLVSQQLPDAAVVSVAHRPELEAFHDRKLVFEHRPGGSRLISDELLKESPLLNGHVSRPPALTQWPRAGHVPSSPAVHLR
jgi:putative ATP-binding cassette transporter